MLACAFAARVQAQGACPASDVRIDYEAHMPNYVMAMAPRTEVQRAFPGVEGVTHRTVYVSSARFITFERGQTLRMQMSKTGAPAPGVHLTDGKGHMITWVGYRQEPLLIQRIDTWKEKLRYDSRTGKATRTTVIAPDAEMRGYLDALEGRLKEVGERTYAGMRCRMKAAPIFGPNAQSCVVRIQGWPVPLFFQVPGIETNWYRATRIVQGACPSASETRLPAGVAIRYVPPVDESDDQD